MIIKKRRYINELIKGESSLLKEPFAVVDFEIRTARNGSKYRWLQLADKTGRIYANQWGKSDFPERMEKGIAVKVDGNYDAEWQNIKIKELHFLKDDESVDEDDFLLKGTRSLEEIEKGFYSYLNIISEPYVSLLRQIFRNEFFRRFSITPASKLIHSAYIGDSEDFVSGGLLEHTLNVVKNCEFLAGLYKANRDLCLAGALIHDIGKTEEYVIKGLVIDSSEGREFNRHIIKGYEKLLEAFSKLNDFPKDREEIIKNMLLSHHGEFEYGSPSKPASLEAVILKLADNTDCEIMHTIEENKRHDGEYYDSVYKRWMMPNWEK